jgi:dTMP kinase
MSFKGTFITFEGIEGCGKTTQMTRLKKHLENRGLPVVTTQEPGEGAVGQAIRRQLLDHHNGKLDTAAEVMLYLADRAQHVTHFIEPALRSGKTVLCDRYTDSTLAYQGYGRGINLEMLKDLNRFVTHGLVPDITFLFDISSEDGFARIRGRALDRMESETLAFHREVREGYLQIARENPDRIVCVNALPSIPEVFDNLLRALAHRGLLREG